MRIGAWGILKGGEDGGVTVRKWVKEGEEEGGRGQVMKRQALRASREEG